MLSRPELIQRHRVADRTVPLVRMNFIASIDGASTHDGLSGGLNNADDKLVFDTLRMLTDVILVGAGTIRAEGYGGVRVSAADAEWRVEHGIPPQPPLAIVSGRLDLDPGHPVFTDAVVRPLIVTHAQSPAAKRDALSRVADVIVCGEDAVDPVAMVLALALRGYPQILCEGGPSLFGALLEANCVDEVCLSVSPVLEGGSAGRISQGHAQATRAMTLWHVFTGGDMVFLRYVRRHRPVPPPQ